MTEYRASVFLLHVKGAVRWSWRVSRYKDGVLYMFLSDRGINPIFSAQPRCWSFINNSFTVPRLYFLTPTPALPLGAPSRSHSPATKASISTKQHASFISPGKIWHLLIIPSQYYSFNQLGPTWVTRFETPCSRPRDLIPRCSWGPSRILPEVNLKLPRDKCWAWREAMRGIACASPLGIVICNLKDYWIFVPINPRIIAVWADGLLTRGGFVWL